MKVGPYNYNEINPGQSLELGYGRINAAAAVAACLPETITPINTSITWDTEKRIANDIIIENGGELKIKAGSLIRMNPNNKVLVMPGGRLIIDGGTITTTCNSMWMGVEVWGNKLLPQVPSSNQGYVEVINNGTIENAICAIRLYHPDTRSFDYKAGGIAMCDQAIFLNNKLSLDARYLSGVNNVSTITNSTFKIDYYYLDWRKGPEGRMYPYFYQHVYLHGVSGMDFYYNKFSNICGYNSSFPYMGIGIRSSNSNFNVLPHCTMAPCEDNPAETNVFTGFEYGIYATNDVSTEKFKVENANFSYNYIGIYTENVPYAKILKNHFNVPAYSTDQWAGGRISTGLYMDVSTGYHVERNIFDGGNEIYGRSNIGAYIKNSGPSTNYIYNNTFQQLGYGSIAEGYNYNEVNTLSGTGLCYKCNDFYDNGADISFVATDKDLPNGIKTYQGAYGNDSTPAGNIFSQQLNSFHINNRSADNEMKYLYHGKSNTVPFNWLIPDSSSNVYRIGVPGVYYSKSKSCKTWIGNSQGSEEKILAEYISNLQAENQVKESILVIQDGGNTEETLNEINISSPEDSFMLTQNLISISPYLSDTILSEIAKEEVVLDNSLVRDILVSNPHAGKSNKILTKLKNRLTPMPNEMFEEIVESSENTSTYEQMLESFENYNSIRYKKFDELIEIYTNESDYPDSMQKLVNLVNLDNSIYAEMILIKRFLSKSLFAEAFTRTSSLHSRFSNNGNISQLQAQIEEFIPIYISLRDTTEIDTMHLITLKNISEFGEYPVNTWADNLVSFIEGSNALETYKLPSLGELRSNMVKLIVTNTRQNSELSIYPNPASSYFIATYNLPNKGANNKIIIRSIEGKILLDSNLSGSNNSKTVYLDNITSGIYIIELLSNNKSIASSKLQVIR